MQASGIFKSAGTDLPVCRTEEEQCCSAEYLEEAQERVEKQLGRALRREFEDVVENYGDEVENLLDCEFCLNRACSNGMYCIQHGDEDPHHPSSQNLCPCIVRCLFVRSIG